MVDLAWNRRKPRARTWTFDDLDRSSRYVMLFDPRSFRWEVYEAGSSSPLVTRVHLNRRSRFDGDGGPATPRRARPEGPRRARPATATSDG
jgi:hypothetical protein